MIYKDMLELQNMFTLAAQEAKAYNKYEYKLNIDESTLIELFKKAFPHIKDDNELANIAKSILDAQ